MLPAIFVCLCSCLCTCTRTHTNMQARERAYNIHLILKRKCESGINGINVSSGERASPLRCLHAARRAGTGTTTRGSTTHCNPRATSLILVSGVKGPRFPILGERNVLYKWCVEGVLSPVKIRCLMTWTVRVIRWSWPWGWITGHGPNPLWVHRTHNSCQTPLAISPQKSWTRSGWTPSQGWSWKGCFLSFWEPQNLVVTWWMRNCAQQVTIAQNSLAPCTQPDREHRGRTVSLTAGYWGRQHEGTIHEQRRAPWGRNLSPHILGRFW